ncbi:hypothetical protein BDV29DRAFT_48303 [Aspergillus leporis]|jgi:hypothetical protein|uniref:Uncharacterized protein n=1 Tax=Aspergillus leporis TaxID=41062 RepID=A0A5N5WQT7_9EURO|nr:hypothetical protein BDV29DRAFT_48303 [Aspergillus leporis]
MTTSQTPASPESLESDLLAHLASTTALEDLHTTLLCSLQRVGWTEKIRKLSLELMRAGRCERFDDVVEAVVASAEGRKHPVLAGLDTTTEDDRNNYNGDGDGDGYFEKVDVRIPQAVVEQGVRAIKEVLREVVVMDDDSDLLDGHHDGGDGRRQEGATETKPSKSSKTGDHSLKNGDTSSPVKKTDKKPKSGKQSK